MEEPHTAICGQQQGIIMDMTNRAAAPARDSMIAISRGQPEKMMQEIQLILPGHHDVRAEDVDLKRLGSILWLAHEKQPADFEELLLLQGVGPRTLQSLALIKTLQAPVYKAKIGESDKQQAIKKLSELAQRAEKDFVPNNNFEQLVEKERGESWKYGGKTVFGDAQPPKRKRNVQLRLF